MSTQALRVDAETRAAIEALVVEYAWCVDHRDVDGLVALFDDDGCLEGVEAEPVRGRQALGEWFAAKSGQAAGATRHVLTNLRLRLDGADAANGWVTQLFFVDAPGGSPVVPRYVGDYEDRYVRRDGEWRFGSRRLTRVLAE